jgi:hypothetical protein
VASIRRTADIYRLEQIAKPADIAVANDAEDDHGAKPVVHCTGCLNSVTLQFSFNLPDARFREVINLEIEGRLPIARRDNRFPAKFSDRRACGRDLSRQAICQWALDRLPV